MITCCLYILKKYEETSVLAICLPPNVCRSQHNSGLDSPLLSQLLSAELVYGRSIVSLPIKDSRLAS